MEQIVGAVTAQGSSPSPGEVDTDADDWPFESVGDPVDEVHIHLGLLNGFELTSGRGSVKLSLGSERLLAFLALGARPMMRNFIAFTLWPDKDEERALGNLRSAVWRLRRVGLGLIESSGQRMRIGRDVAVDLHRAVLVARRVLDGTPIRDARRVQELLTTGDLLTDWYDPWVSPERERLRQLRLHALESLSAGLLECGDLTGALEAGLAAVSAEPLRESAHRALVAAHLAEGNPAEALRQYESYRYLAATELGILPSAQLEELIQPLRAVPVGAQR